MTKRVLILGIGGMDGSYCAEQLLDEGCEVHGLVRRSSADNLWRVRTLLELRKGRMFLHPGDLLDVESINHVLGQFCPDEVYNFADQDHVDFSYKTPSYSNSVTTGGVVNVLECLRRRNTKFPCRFLQPLSATIFGNSPHPQDERTPLAPASPYACAKAAVWFWCRHYRREYGLHVSCPIFFNHDTNTAETPVCIRDKEGLVNVVALDEIAPFECLRVNDNPGLDIWDNGQWTALTAISRYVEVNKAVVRVSSRSGFVECTVGHVVCSPNGDKPVEEFAPGDTVQPVAFPDHQGVSSESVALAWLTGFFVGDGSLHGGNRAKGRGYLDFFNAKMKLLKVVEQNVKLADPDAEVIYKPCASRYKPGKVNHTLRVFSDRLKGVMSGCYYECRPQAMKKVPKWVFNSSRQVVEAFLDGYCDADGTKSLPDVCYKFQCYTTKSQVLAAGLRILCHWTGRHVTYNCECRDGGYPRFYHRGMIRSRRNKSPHGQSGRTGFHLIRNPLEVRKVWHGTASDFVTVTTGSGTYSAGTGLVRIHNSPRRQGDYLLHKVAKQALAVSREGGDFKVGNPNQQVDIGYAPEYVAAAIKLLRLNVPTDVVVGTEKGWRILDLCGEAYDEAWKKVSYSNLRSSYGVSSDGFSRPGGTPTLIADTRAARELLSFSPGEDAGSVVRRLVRHYAGKEVG